MLNKSLHFFAAANGADGFYSYYNRIFGVYDFERLYIIKGGPGTGKSRLLYELADTSEARGYDVGYFHCSSDPSSLDGIIIKRTRDCGYTESLAFIDGTSPHSQEASLPGAADELFDLGAFWSADALAPHREKIKLLNEKKAESFGRAYELFKIAGGVESYIGGIGRGLADGEKLKKAVAKYSKMIPRGSGYSAEYRLRSALTMDGEYIFDSYRELAEKSVIIYDRGGIAYEYLNLIHAVAKEKKQAVVLSPTPLLKDRLDAIYIPAAKLSFSVCRIKAESDGADSITDSVKWLRTDAYRAARPELRRLSALSEKLTEEGLSKLGRAKGSHFALEKIYSEAMDFGAKETACSAFVKKVLG